MPKVRNQSRAELLDAHMQLLQRIHDRDTRIARLEEQLAARNAELDQFRAAAAARSSALSPPIPRRITR